MKRWWAHLVDVIGQLMPLAMTSDLLSICLCDGSCLGNASPLPLPCASMWLGPVPSDPSHCSPPLNQSTTLLFISYNLFVFRPLTRLSVHQMGCLQSHSLMKCFLLTETEVRWNWIFKPGGGGEKSTATIFFGSEGRGMGLISILCQLNQPNLSF